MEDSPKKIKKVLEELGFNPKASMSTKAAFIKHLAKAAYGVDLKVPALFDENNEANVDSAFASPTEQLELPLDRAE